MPSFRLRLGQQAQDLEKYEIYWAEWDYNMLVSKGEAPSEEMPKQGVKPITPDMNFQRWWPSFSQKF